MMKFLGLLVLASAVAVAPVAAYHRKDAGRACPAKKECKTCHHCPCTCTATDKAQARAHKRAAKKAKKGQKKHEHKKHENNEKHDAKKRSAW